MRCQIAYIHVYSTLCDPQHVRRPGTNPLRTLLTKIDTLRPKVFLWANLGLSAFVALAHGGALLAVRAKPIPDAGAIERIAAVSLPLAGLIGCSAAAALFWKPLQSLTLGFHGIVLAAAAMFELAWGVSLVLNGVPAGNFSWSVGLFSASVCYSALVLSRFSVPTQYRSSALVYFIPVVALAIAVPLDIGVFVRGVQQVAAHFGA